jgi:hypothetical protein
MNFLNDTAEIRVLFDEPRAVRWRRQDDTSLADELHLAVDNAYT